MTSLHSDPNATAAANAAWSWIQRGERTLMRAQLMKLTPSQLDELSMAAAILIAAAMEIAERLTAAAVLAPDSLPEGFKVHGIHTEAVAS